MKPYNNLSSHNLGLLLFLARFAAVLGIISFVLPLCLFIVSALMQEVFGVASTLVFVPISISILFLSGLMAAVVAFEENYRIRTEHLINQEKIQKIV